MENIRDLNEDEFGCFLTAELSQLKDVTLVLLKGHLFIEFAINCYLESIRLLNKLRNGIAHSLNVNEQLIQEFLASLDKVVPSNKGSFRNEELDIPLRLTSGIAIICGIVFGSYLEGRDQRINRNIV